MKIDKSPTDTQKCVDEAKRGGLRYACREGREAAPDLRNCMAYMFVTGRCCAYSQHPLDGEEAAKDRLRVV